jgi:subtilisin family serine protease
MSATVNPRSTRQITSGTITAAMAGVAAGAILGAFVVQGPVMADRIRNEQWYLQRLNASAAWRYSTGAGVLVAVLDSGVDATHPDLVGQVLPGAGFVAGSQTDGRVDPVGHGTTVAAIIAGRADDGTGVRGLAPNARILPVRVLDDDNKYDDATVVANGLRWAVEHGASVVNLSLGGTVRSQSLADALGYAAAHDVVVVSCTGNRTATDPTRSEVWYPAREPGVVAVSGLASPSTANQQTTVAVPATPRGGAGAGAGAMDTLWAGSVTGPQTVLVAPAADLTGARPGGYWRVQGTSFAAPLVAATAALIRSRWPSLDAANVINRMIRTARDLGATGRDDQYGFGEVDPYSALNATVPLVRTNPLTGAKTDTADQVAAAAQADEARPNGAQRNSAQRNGARAGEARDGRAPRAIAAATRQTIAGTDVLGGSAVGGVLLIGLVVVLLRLRSRTLRSRTLRSRTLRTRTLRSRTVRSRTLRTPALRTPALQARALQARALPARAPWETGHREEPGGIDPGPRKERSGAPLGVGPLGC